MDIGEIIIQLRKQNSMTQEQLGKNIGVSKNMICMYEKGKRVPGRDTVLKIADLFNVSADYIFGREEDIFNVPPSSARYLHEDPEEFRYLPIVPKYDSCESLKSDQPDSYAEEKDLLAVTRQDEMLYVKLSTDQWVLVDKDCKEGKNLCVITDNKIRIIKSNELTGNDEVIGEAISIVTLL